MLRKLCVMYFRGYTDNSGISDTATPLNKIYLSQTFLVPKHELFWVRGGYTKHPAALWILGNQPSVFAMAVK